MLFRALCSVVALCLSMAATHAETVQSAGILPVISTRGSLLPVSHSDASIATRRSASLFLDKSAGGLFTPIAPRPTPQPFGSVHDQVQGILDLIARAEAGPKGYDAVQYGAKIQPRRPPTQLTLAEIETWTRSTPRQQHAIGRYQFIPATLRRLVKDQGLTPDTRFSPQVQDQLAHQLLVEAGLNAFTNGTMTRGDFMLNLAKIWAGLPTATGRSYYKGVANNKATISWDHFYREITALFPGQA